MWRSRETSTLFNNYILSTSSKVLVTGTAGFIGFHLVSRLITDGFDVLGLDIINDYYDINLKYARLKEHGIDPSKITYGSPISSSVYPNYRFVKLDLADFDAVVSLFDAEQFDYVVNLAAQAGVRYSIDNPRAYTHSNIDGFLSILEGCRNTQVEHLVYASTSSVYGLNTEMPLKESAPTEHPMALYAATKKANEMMAHSYSHLFDLPTTGLRFFTVYGPWGRPDMAYFIFTKAILGKEPIKIFNNGIMMRDFTYVGDIVESICRLIVKPAKSNFDWSGDVPGIATSSAPYQLFNIGNGKPIHLMDYIYALEDCLGVKAEHHMMENQPGDVPATHADTSRLEAYVGYTPNTSVKDGIAQFVEWYRKYYKLV